MGLEVEESSLRTIVLMVRVGEKDQGRSLAVRFTLVDVKFSYNAIMGFPLINKVKAIISLDIKLAI